MLSELKEKKMISDDASTVLKLSLPGAAVEFINRLDMPNSKEKYPPELKAFALTLNFYSTKAYNYVRKTFECNLPHPTTLRKWYQSINGSPGFTGEAFSSLKVKAEEAEKKSTTIQCALMVNEIAIKKHVEWDRTKFSGYIDLGTDLDDDELLIAKEALVFMVNALNSNWKVPVGYFLINGLSAPERANLINEALRYIHDTGVDVVSLTFDGTSSNIAAANELGANIAVNNLVNFFPHPVTRNPIYVIFDACHMLKLVRNCLASKGSLHDWKNLVNWKYITELEKLQREEGLHAATKLRLRHVQWYREKMKVKLAAQVLSRSVADALEYALHHLKHPKFEGCEATILFLKKFNDLFDVLNSRNFLGKGYKSPFMEKNKTKFFQLLDETEAYIRGLKTSSNGELLLTSQRKTGFLGFLVTLKSIKLLFLSLCEGGDLKFLLTYKLSQDHLELFFSAIRSHGGHNNNPTAKQFKAAYVRLLAHHQIMTSDSANCTILDDTNILNVSASKNTYLKSINDSDAQRDDIDQWPAVESLVQDHNYCVNAFRHQSQYSQDVIGYVAGFVVKKLKTSLRCVDCISAVVEKSKSPSNLLLIKNRGGLNLPSDDITNLCKLGEKVFRIFNAAGKLTVRNVMHRLILYTLNDIMSKGMDIFPSLIKHSVDHAPQDNHRIFLIKAVLFEYFKLRLCHAGKTETEKLQANKTRSLNLKSTLFKGH
ncbi:DNA transposase THAP9 [Araneus ventricosus]|uniref:DNA transposase THAP9 n=1 Tax=Araneus ventricosus TaxID=182803 RepID=A0A4Y2TUG8_ARAVE|nr:DNA transposase THAP9 [Araneus ventricosus]